MIQVLPGVLLNSSTKRGYSLGSVKVQGKKSHWDASVRPMSRSRFFRCLLRFFTMRFLRLSWNVKHRNWEKYCCWNIKFMVPKHGRPMLPHLIVVTKMVYSHMFLQVWMIIILPQVGQTTPIEVPVSITVRQRVSVRFKPQVRWKRCWWHDDKEPTILTLWLPPNLVFGAKHPVWCCGDHICNAHIFFLSWGDTVNACEQADCWIRWNFINPKGNYCAGNRPKLQQQSIKSIKY